MITASKNYDKICVHELFARQAQKRPDAIAIKYGEQHLSYGELNRRSNQLARYLANLHVGPEAIVGIYLNRSIEMAVGILGILKSGGAYVPLDPSCPKERITYMQVC